MLDVVMHGSAMKRIAFYTFILAAFTAGCASESVRFDDDDLVISLVRSRSDADLRAYTLRIENAGDAPLYHLNFYLSFPIPDGNGSESNPYRLEGRTDASKPYDLPAGEAIEVDFAAPLSKGSSGWDWDNPTLSIDGVLKDGNREIPFGLSGGLDAYLERRRD